MMRLRAGWQRWRALQRQRERRVATARINQPHHGGRNVVVPKCAKALRNLDAVRVVRVYPMGC